MLSEEQLFQDFSKVHFFPLPTQGKEGKCGDTPHPVKGLLPLETLLHSTFEKPWQLFRCKLVPGHNSMRRYYHVNFKPLNAAGSNLPELHWW